MLKREEPLWMPAGSVRAIITIMLLIMLGMTIFYDVGEASMAVIAGLAGTAITSYFNSRQDNNKENGNA